MSATYDHSARTIEPGDYAWLVTDDGGHGGYTPARIIRVNRRTVTVETYWQRGEAQRVPFDGGPAIVYAGEDAAGYFA